MTNFINKFFENKPLNLLKKNFLNNTNKTNAISNPKLFRRLLVARNTTSLKSQLESFANTYPNHSDILVVADYSKEAIQSIQTAQRFKEESTQDIQIKVIHIVDMSPMDRYYSIGMSSLFSEVLLKNERKSFFKYLKRHGIDHSSISVKVQLVRGKEVMDDLYRLINVRNPDLVLLGKKSYSKLNNYLIKSNELYKEKSNIRHPVIVMP